MFSRRTKVFTPSIKDKYLKLKLRKNKIFRSTKLTNYIFDQFGLPKSYNCYVEIRKVILSQITSDGETDQETEDSDFQALVDNVVLKINHLKDQVNEFEKTSTSAWHAGFGNRAVDENAVESNSESSEVDIEDHDKSTSKNKRNVKTKKTPAKRVTTRRQTRQAAKSLPVQNKSKNKKSQNTTRKKAVEDDSSANEDSDDELEEEVPVRKGRSRPVVTKSVTKNVKEPPVRSAKKTAPAIDEGRCSEEIPPTPPTSQNDPEPEVLLEANSRAKQTTLDKFFNTRNKSANMNSNLFESPEKVSPKKEPGSAIKSPFSVERRRLNSLTPSKCMTLISPLKIDVLEKNLINEIDEMSNNQLTEMLNSQIFEEIATDATLDMFSTLRDFTEPIAQNTAINNTQLNVASQVSVPEHDFEMKNVVNSTPINVARNKQHEKTELPAIAENEATAENEESLQDDSFSQVPPTQVTPTKPRNLPKVIQSTVVNTKYIIREQDKDTDKPAVPEENPEEPEKMADEANQSKGEDRSDDGDLWKEEDEKMDVEEEPAAEIECNDDSVTSFESAKEIIEPVQSSGSNQEGDDKTENQESNDSASKYETNKSASDCESHHSNKSEISNVATEFAELSQYPRWKRQSDIYTDSEEETNRSEKSDKAEGNPLVENPTPSQLQLSEENESDSSSGRRSPGPLPNGSLPVNDEDADGKETSENISNVSRMNLLLESESSGDEAAGLNFRSENSRDGDEIELKVEKMLEDVVPPKDNLEEKEGSEHSQDKSEVSGSQATEVEGTEKKIEATRFTEEAQDGEKVLEDEGSNCLQKKPEDSESQDTEVEVKTEKLEATKPTEESKEGDKVLEDKEGSNCSQMIPENYESQDTEVEGKKKKKKRKKKAKATGSAGESKEIEEKSEGSKSSSFEKPEDSGQDTETEANKKKKKMRLEETRSAEESEEIEEKIEGPKSPSFKEPEDSGQDTETETKKKKKKKRLQETNSADKSKEKEQSEERIEGPKSPVFEKPEDSGLDTETESKKKKKKKRLEETKSADKIEEERTRSLADKSEASESQDTDVEGKRKKKKKTKKETAEDKPELQSRDISTSDDERRSALQSQLTIVQTEDEELDDKEVTAIKHVHGMDLLANSDSSDEGTSGFHIRTENSNKVVGTDVPMVSENEEEGKTKSTDRRKEKRKTAENSPVEKVEAEEKKKETVEDENVSEVRPEDPKSEGEETPSASRYVYRRPSNEEDDENVNQETINRLNSICRLNFAGESDSNSENEQTFSADTAYRVTKIKDDAIKVDEDETESLVKIKRDDKLLSKSEVKLEKLNASPTKKVVENGGEKRRKVKRKKRVSESSKKNDDVSNDSDWSVASEETDDDDLDVSRKTQVSLVTPREKDNLRAVKRSVKLINRSLISSGTLSQSKIKQDSEDEPVSSLSELIEREKLVEETRDCTFSLDDLGPDDELFVFNMPTKILTASLKGDKFTVAKTSLTIGSKKYAIQQKQSKEVACMAQVVDEKGNKKYKPVNIRPSGNVNVLHQMRVRSNRSSSKCSSRSSSVSKVSDPKKTTKRKANSDCETSSVKKTKLEITRSSINDLSDFSE